MKSREEFIRNLKKEVDELEKQINNDETSKVKNKKIKKTAKIGLTTAFILPVIASSFIVYNGLKKINMTPFKIDKVTSCAKIITTKTTTNKYKEKVTYEHNFKYCPTFEYSTGWKLNENNLFEREITAYRLNDEINKIDTDKILKMNYEEIKQFFTVINKEKIQKSFLEEEDYFYTDNMFIITDMHKDKNKIKIINESEDSQLVDSLSYILILFFLFIIYTNCINKEKIYIKINNYIDKKYPIIEEDNLEKLKEILKIRKENMELFEEPKKIYINKR